MTTRLQSIRERWEAATPGPWKATFDRYEGVSDRGRAIEDRNDDTPAFRKALKTGDIVEFWGIDEIDACELAPNDANAIASAPDDIAYLLRLADAADEFAREVERTNPDFAALQAWRQAREG